MNQGISRQDRRLLKLHQSHHYAPNNPKRERLGSFSGQNLPIQCQGNGRITSHADGGNSIARILYVIAD
jgi:hypothetical protein